MRIIVLLAVLCPLVPLEAQEKPARDEGFTPLFNGQDLTGWKQYAGKDKTWVVEDGVLVCTGSGGGWLGSERDYADFEVRLEYRLTPGGNSGVYIRAPSEGWISRVGMEVQLLDDLHPKYAKLDFHQYTGAIYHVVAPTRRATKAAGQWNAIAIRAVGRQVMVRLNGQLIVDADLDRSLKDVAVAKEHPGLKRATGKIGLQSHTDRVEFRNILIKEIKAN